MLTYQSYNNATNWGGVGRIKYKFIINGKEFDGDTRLVRPDFYTVRRIIYYDCPFSARSYWK
ncbi:hypothetical protein BW716_34200 [[Flexibacter] sp. ATCC 35208]|nr:hypothetical protein BW716_34200 [[Flexibacter] sp. ATCC 35208]